MANQPTRKSRRPNRASVLEVRVMSPRIAWLRVLTISRSLLKLAAAVAVVVGLAWVGWRGIEKAFYQNPDFRLQVIDLNSNPVMDAAGLAKITDIDLRASLFKINLVAVEAKLKAQPAIADAKAERHLPGTLSIRLTPRLPRAWLASSTGEATAVRRVGGTLVDRDGFAFACAELQLETAQHLPIILLPPSETLWIRCGEAIKQPELKHCFHLLDAACKADSEAIQWVESIRQVNAWSLELTTRQGTVATFGLGDHERQITSLQASNDHASAKGYSIATINLIPKYNIPITVRNVTVTPHLTLPVELSPADTRTNRRAKDLSTLLNRN